MLFGLFDKKEPTEDWTRLIKILDIINIDISRIKKDLEMLQAKFRSKVFKEAPEDEPEESKKIDDGFDELRNL